MPSPFPGMNPYLEQDDVWQDFHESIIPALREELVKQISPAYIVKVEEHLYIHERSADERRFIGRTDVSLSPDAEHRREWSSTTAMAAPVYGRIPVAVDVERLSYVAVRDRQNRELITVIKVLSPSNKNPGPDRDQDLNKRQQLLVTRVHIVELDLLRGGPRLPVDNLPQCDYCILVSHADDRPRVALWPIGVRDPLPHVPVPLREPPDASIDLKSVIDRVYDAAGYGSYICRGSPQPALRPGDAEWTQQFVPSA